MVLELQAHQSELRVLLRSCRCRWQSINNGREEGYWVVFSLQSMNMTKYCFCYLIHRKVDQTGGEIIVLFFNHIFKKAIEN